MSWIGVDLDGTLAVHLAMQAMYPIGPPIPAMVERVRGWLAAGEEVRIVTARVSVPDLAELAYATAAIEVWCREHIGRVLPVTCSKDFGMLALYDDRAVQVETNTGRLVI